MVSDDNSLDENDNNEKLYRIRQATANNMLSRRNNNGNKMKFHHHQTPSFLLAVIGIILAVSSSCDAFTPPLATLSSTNAVSSTGLFVGTQSSNQQQQPKGQRRRGPKKKNPNNRLEFDSEDLTSSENVIYEGCPGCTMRANVADVDVVESARLFFSSPSIQRHTLDNSDSDFKVIVPSEITHWRTQAKLAVAPKSTWGRDGCVFGLYRRGSHEVVSCPDCRAHDQTINRAVALLTQATRAVRTDSYDEQTGTGSLRYVQLQVERSTEQICLTLVWNADKLKDCQPGLSRLTKELKRLDRTIWHSMWVHCNNGLGNNIFARGDGRWHKVDGPEFVREKLPSFSSSNNHNGINAGEQKKEGLLYFNPMVFRQGNLDGFDTIARHVATLVPNTNPAVCELYAGVGVLGLTALSYHADKDTPLKWLRCSDENPANPRCFHRSVNSIPAEVTGRSKHFSEHKKKGKRSKKVYTVDSMVDRSSSSSSSSLPSANNRGTADGKVSYTVASATKALLAGQALGADVLIVDPPRKGLDEEVVLQLCREFNPNQPPVEDRRMLFGKSHTHNLVNEVKTLIYVSCGFDALARDTDALLKADVGWKLESATGYVLFPGSNHVETVAVFQREGRGVNGGEDDY